MDHPRPWLRYVDAGDLDNKTFPFDGLEVDSIGGETLGKVEGFIIDANSGRPYHVVVGSGGWFKHKHVLLPIGHITLDPNGKMLVADIGRDRVERFPGFDKDEFEKLSAEELDRMDDTLVACCSVGISTHAPLPHRGGKPPTIATRPGGRRTSIGRSGQTSWGSR